MLDFEVMGRKQTPDAEYNGKTRDNLIPDRYFLEENFGGWKRHIILEDKGDSKDEGNENRQGPLPEQLSFLLAKIVEHLKGRFENRQPKESADRDEQCSQDQTDE